MQTPSASELLGAWECGLAEPPCMRAAALLRLALPESSAERLAELSIGQRDACLLDLRESSFGRRVIGVASCPGCAELLELDFDIREVRVSPDQSSAPAALAVAGYEVRFRLPTMQDLLASLHPNDLEATRQALLERAVIRASHAGEAVTPVALPTEVAELVEARLGELDPQADVRLALSCSDCGQEWDARFDIATFLWSELDAWAGRLLYEVHLLASAYCWRETDILALSPARRRFYLEAVSA